MDGIQEDRQSAAFRPPFNFYRSQGLETPLFGAYYTELDMISQKNSPKTLLTFHYSVVTIYLVILNKDTQYIVCGANF